MGVWCGDFFKGGSVDCEIWVVGLGFKGRQFCGICPWLFAFRSCPLSLDVLPPLVFLILALLPSLSPFCS